MKRYVKCSVSNNILFKAIKLYNADGPAHIYLNKDKTAFRYESYEKDFYEFGYVSDLLAAFDQVLSSGEYDTQSEEDLVDAFYEAREILSDEGKIETQGAHHAFETSGLIAWVKSKNREYGFNVLSDDEGYDKARSVYDIILELCDQNNIPVSERQIAWMQRKWNNTNELKYIATVKPKLHEVKFTGGYGGLAENFLGTPGYKYKKQFIQMLNDNAQFIMNEAGLTDMTVNSRSGSITFHY